MSLKYRAETFYGKKQFMKKDLLNLVFLLASVGLVPVLGCHGAIGEHIGNFDVRPDFKVIGSVAELRDCMAASGAKIRMKPGSYRITDAAPDNKTVFHVTGSDNYFDLRGVTLQIDTAVLAAFKGKVHEASTYTIPGDNQTFEGAVFEDIGDQPPGLGLPEFNVIGNNNTFRDCSFIIRGSAPYGYGDYFGKGGHNKTRLQKHAAMRVAGDNTQILGCTFRIHTFGHAIAMQGAQNTLIKDVSIEGALRSSDEILAEKTGLATKLGFRDIHDRPIKPGLMVCLAEDGIRAYVDGTRNGQKRRTGDITVVNCTVKRMRGGIALAGASGKVDVRGCTVVESGYPGDGYAVPSGAVVRDCKGDAAYAPLLRLGYSHKKDADIELQLMDAKRYADGHPLALINGAGHKITIKKADGKPLGAGLAIVCGQTYRGDEQDVGKTFAKKITLINRTAQPVLLTDLSSGCEVISRGEVKDEGSKNNVSIDTNK
jgi:hypothetical protein